MAKSKRKGTEIKSKKQTVFLFIFPSILLFILLFITTMISLSADLQRDNNFIVLLCVIALGSSASGFLSGKIKREKGMLTGIVFVLPSIILLSLISLILNKFSFDINLVISIFVSILSAAVGGITGVNIKQKAKRVKK